MAVPRPAVTLVQTLVLRPATGAVLLGRWQSGPFAGRYSGLIGEASKASGPPPVPEVAAATVCSKLLGPGVNVDPRRLRRRALLRFRELDTSSGSGAVLGAEYQEHQLLMRLRPEEEESVGRAGASFAPANTSEFHYEWFEPDQIPYESMPEDDIYWYRRVLHENQLLRGSFDFDGTKLVDHDLEELPPTEGLSERMAPCDGPLLLHNPACSKSRALKEMLRKRGDDFSERLYLEDPLSLTELETLCARVQATLQLDSRMDALAALSRELAAADADLALEHFAANPANMQRPVLINGFQAALGRPGPAQALTLLE